jgi:hypothetical protein
MSENTLSKGTVSQNGYFFLGLYILINTFCVYADGFQGLSKAFHYPIQLLTLLLKMLTETLLRIPYFVIFFRKKISLLVLRFSPFRTFSR